MEYLEYNINKTEERIYSDNLEIRCRKNQKDFTRKRKLTAKNLLLYTINNRGKTTKMELYDFIKEVEIENVTDSALLQQREKLNENVFKELAKASLVDFYEKFPDEVKKYKNKYVIAAIDGSDCEVPNTKETRERYQSINSSNNDRVARIKLSNCYDVLNKYVLDTEIEEYKHSELDLANRHMKATNYIGKYFDIVYVMDRGYLSLSNFYHWDKNGIKFIVRLNRSKLKLEQSMMTSNDEVMQIQYQYNRIKNYKDKDVEFYEYYENGNRVSLRFVNITLPTGEIETLITNLSKEEFSTEDMNELYQLRWGVETSYHELKESMQVTNISSSKDTIIKQEIYSQMFVYNVIQSICNDLSTQISQEKFKHPMKINFNMAVGFVKRFFIRILIEEDKDKKDKLVKELFDNILRNLIPIRKGRNYGRYKNRKLTNKHPINKRKSF